MMKKRNVRLLRLTAVLIGFFVVFNLLAYSHARAMLRFTPSGTRTLKPEALSFWTKAKLLVIGVKVPRPLGTEAPAALASNCRAITIQVAAAAELSAWYCNQGSTTPLVILFHGYTAEKTCMLQEAKLLLGMGLSVLLVDFRGSGGASESYTTIGVCEAEDVAAVVDYANEALPHASTILLGQSMGAVAICEPFIRTPLPPMLLSLRPCLIRC
jgi:predicted alpha/beta-fold hydrolase